MHAWAHCGGAFARARVFVFGLVTALGALLPLPAAASAPPENDQTEAYAGEVGPPIPMPSGTGDASAALALWPAGRRGFMLGDHAGASGGYRTLIAVDLDSGQEVGRASLDPPAPELTFADTGMPTLMTVDPDTGAVFVASALPSALGSLVTSGPPAQVAASLVGNSAATAVRAAGGRLCPMPVVQCLGGVHMLDPVTLTPIRHIPVRTVEASGGAAASHLRAMSYAPPRVPGDSPKLHLVVEDAVLAPLGLGEPNQPRQGVTNLVYAIQLDVESGRQDWTVRVDACRGTRENREASRMVAERARPHAATIMRLREAGQGAAVLVGCHGGNQTGAIVRIPLDEGGYPPAMPVVVRDLDAEQAASPEAATAGRPDAPVRQSPATVVFYGPEKVLEFLSDPFSARVLLRVVANEAEVWWVYDAHLGMVVGTLGIGSYSVGETRSGFDAASGRLYVLGASRAGTGNRSATAGGLFVADVRRRPLAQPLVFPSLARHATGLPVPMPVDPGDGERRPRLYVRQGSPPTGWVPIEDRLMAPEFVVDPDTDRRSLDLDEVQGVTDRAFDGAARGYGARALLLAGAEGMGRIGPLDALGSAKYGTAVVRYNWQHNQEQGSEPWSTLGAPPRHLEDDPCTDIDREVILAFVGPEGPAVVDSTGARGSAKPVVADERTRADLDAPASRCSRTDWSTLWGTALFGQPPTDEPAVPWMLGDGMATCVSGGTEHATLGDAVAGTAFAQVSCAEEETSGVSYARGSRIESAVVAEAVSSFRVYLDPGRGVVSRVESVARGIDVDGVLRIDTVRAAAESWANGRRQPVPAAQRESGYDPNCDTSRTAGTCFRRHVFGVRTPGYACGPCGDEAALIDGLARGFGAYGTVRLRNPDPVLAKGAESGFIAAVQKPDAERFADLVLNNDLLQTIVPALEVVRYAPAQRLNGAGAPGRQLYQFAGVEVSSSYGISCLLVYDEATNTCAAATELPGSIQVSLADTEDRPLAGGAFEVRADMDADGLLGLADTVLPDGACVTAQDGVGTCRFEDLEPGPYLVSQVAAPPGYAKAAEPFLVELASGEARTVAFTNASDVSTVELKVTDEAGAPLRGAGFATYADADADGKVAPDAQPAAECTTDERGVCRMEVPAGSYVLVQTSVPGGLAPIEPVAFTFASGGQVAAVTVVNYPPDAPSRPPAAAPPVYTPPVDVAPPVESIDSGYTPSVEPAPLPETVPGEGIVDQVGGTVVQVIRAPGDALRLLSRDPKQAVAWTAALALFCLAAMAVRRRQAALAMMGR